VPVPQGKKTSDVCVCTLSLKARNEAEVSSTPDSTSVCKKTTRGASSCGTLEPRIFASTSARTVIRHRRRRPPPWPCGLVLPSGAVQVSAQLSSKQAGLPMYFLQGLPWQGLSAQRVVLQHDSSHVILRIDKNPKTGCERIRLNRLGQAIRMPTPTSRRSRPGGASGRSPRRGRCADWRKNLRSFNCMVMNAG